MLLSEDTVRSRIDERHWRVVDGRLEATVATGSFLAGLDLVTAVAEIAERSGHHPDVLLTYPSVRLTSVTHDVGGLTERDVALATAISRLLDERERAAHGRRDAAT